MQPNIREPTNCHGCYLRIEVEKMKAFRMMTLMLGLLVSALSAGHAQAIYMDWAKPPDCKADYCPWMDPANRGDGQNKLQDFTPGFRALYPGGNQEKMTPRERRMLRGYYGLPTKRYYGRNRWIGEITPSRFPWYYSPAPPEPLQLFRPERGPGIYYERGRVPSTYASPSAKWSVERWSGQ